MEYGISRNKSRMSMKIIEFMSFNAIWITNENARCSSWIKLCSMYEVET
jgi:hypothetical protein